MWRMYFIKYFSSPRLFRIHGNAAVPSHNYQPNIVEATADGLLKSMGIFKAICYYTSPILFIFLYKRGFLSVDRIDGFTKMMIGCLVLYFLSYITRGIGRSMNKDYCSFMNALSTARKRNTAEAKERLRSYDSEFWAWPVDYQWKEFLPRLQPLIRVPKMEDPAFSDEGIKEKLIGYFLAVLGYFAVSCFGCKLMYPGCTSMQYLLNHFLIQGRAKLIEEKNGQRAKLFAYDGNQIDTIFIDQRTSTSKILSKTLVIVCEGNAGFYEIGACSTPLDAGYSVLGWNYPGFAGSSGVPWPYNVQNAADIVMQYAMKILNFKQEEIMVYAWSIGGYPATWLSMNYPNIKGLILDATFDHVMPLAVHRMPGSWRRLVATAVKSHLNLNNSEQICRYDGPVLLIRRSRDEMITLGDATDISTNRGNDLLVQLLHNRYPFIVDRSTIPLVRFFLTKERHEQTPILLEHRVDEANCEQALKNYSEENGSTFPVNLGSDGYLGQSTKNKISLFLIWKHMEDFDEGHSAPLPVHFFKQPWSLH